MSAPKKAFNAVPPPPQLLNGVKTVGNQPIAPPSKDDAFVEAVKRAQEIAARLSGKASAPPTDDDDDLPYQELPEDAATRKRKTNWDEQEAADSNSSRNRNDGPPNSPPSSSYNARAPPQQSGGGGGGGHYGPAPTSSGGHYGPPPSNQQGGHYGPPPPSNQQDEPPYSPGSPPQSSQSSQGNMPYGGPPPWATDGGQGGARGGVGHYGPSGGGEATERLSIPSSMVGLIIGKGGEKIKELQQRSGARIQIIREPEQNPNPNEKIVLIHGTSDSVTHAKSLLNTLIFAKEQGAPIPGMGGMPMMGMPLGPPGTITIHVMIPSHLVGYFIGKAGANINQMKQDSGAHIMVVKSNDMTAKETAIAVSGTPDAVRMAEQMIRQRVDEAPPSAGRKYKEQQAAAVAAAGGDDSPSSSSSSSSSYSQGAYPYGSDPYSGYYGYQYPYGYGGYPGGWQGQYDWSQQQGQDPSQQQQQQQQGQNWGGYGGYPQQYPSDAGHNQDSNDGQK
jgi:hypothetical protein